ncbi:MAG: DUF2927 domain-containing protein [Cyanobacteria bacterium J06632_19]
MISKKLDKKMIATLAILVSLFILLGIFFLKIKDSSDDYILSDYEENLLKYFKEIVLESEFYDSPKKVVKWRKPMILFISKEEECEKQIKVIQSTIQRINALATDGFEIRLTDDIAKSNSILYLSTIDKVAELDAEFYSYMENGIVDEDFVGFTYVEFEWSDYTITKSSIFIDIEDSTDIQESTILEEVTQSLGIPNDSEKYPNSVFYQYQIEENCINKEYSKMDEDIVRLLYHPEMNPGIDNTQVEKVIKRILSSDKFYISN